MATGKCELLAPAGSYDAFRAGLCAGADAFYLGGSRFGARAYADNFTEDVLKRTIDEAHLFDRKIYLTVNTLFKEPELEELYAFLLPFYRQGLDAVIVQDMGALRLIHSAFPDLAIHASTQMTVTGVHGATLLETYGVKRVVPARELSLAEIRNIREASDLEIECFVHGALCYSYSGQCLMSSFFGGRSGNRGKCAQPCRLPYQVSENGRILSNEKKAYPLNTKDICLIDHTAELIEAGITSFKIEGRMKRPEYTAGVVSIYRKYLDLYEEKRCAVRADAADRAFLEALFNRDGFSRSYYFQHNGPEMMALQNRKMTEPRMQKAEEAYAFVREKILSEEPKKGVYGRFALRETGGASLTVSDGICEGTAVSEEAQASVNRPLEEETVRRQLNRTGGSAFFFENLEIRLADSRFLTMKQLNELRRNAFADLEKQIMLRHRKVTPEWYPEAKSVPGKTSGAQPQVWVSVSTEEQYEAVCRAEGIAGFYLPPALYGKLSEKEKSGRLPENVMIALPYITRQTDGGKWEEELTAWAKAGVRFLVRSLEDAAFLIQNGYSAAVRPDYTLYEMNAGAQAFWAAYGITENTIPAELNRKEIRRRDNTDAELIVYGRIPLMVSAQCIRKNYAKCTASGGQMLLTDRKNVQFPVSFVCDPCYNLIYNSVPVSLLSVAGEALQSHAARYRISLTLESGAESKQRVSEFRNAFCGHFEEGREDFLYTRGHFNRGVE